MKSSQTNHENPPTASASSPRNNPCLERDSNIAALKVIAASGVSYLLPYAQFLYADKISNPAWEKEPDSPSKWQPKFGTGRGKGQRVRCAVATWRRALDANHILNPGKMS